MRRGNGGKGDAEGKSAVVCHGLIRFLARFSRFVACKVVSCCLLQSSDKQEFQVDEDVAFQSITVKNMLEDTGADFAVPLPNVNGATLSKVLEYCSKHRW